MRPARLLVFDLDGTLVDSSGDLATAVNAALAAVAPGTPPLPTARVRALVGSGARTLVARCLATAGVAHPVDAVLPMFLERYRSCMLDQTRPYPGVPEALDRLGGLALAVLTNKPGDMSREILSRLGLLQRFFRVYGGGDLHDGKPDPVGLNLLLREAQVAPGEGVMVGDSAIDVRTGRAAGVFTVGVTYGFDPASFAAEPPDLLLDDLRELPERLSLQ